MFVLLFINSNRERDPLYDVTCDKQAIHMDIEADNVCFFNEDWPKKRYNYRVSSRNSFGEDEEEATYQVDLSVYFDGEFRVKGQISLTEWTN